MINQELLFYIKEQLNAGAKKEQVKNALILAGWDEFDIDETLNFVVPIEKLNILPKIESSKPVGLQDRVKINEVKPEPKIQEVKQNSLEALNVYAPSNINQTPYFSGMPKVSSPTQNQGTNNFIKTKENVLPKKKGLGRSLLFGLIFSLVVASGLYFYRFYINPTDDYILKTARLNFLELNSIKYDTEISTEISYGEEVKNTVEDLGIFIPNDVESQTNIPLTAFFSGSLSNLHSDTESFLNFSFKTGDSDILNFEFDGEALLKKDILYMRASDVRESDYLAEFFDIERKPWFFHEDKSIVNDDRLQTLVSTMRTILSMGTLVPEFIKNEAISITSKLPGAVIDDVEMVRYQFSFNTEKSLLSLPKEPNVLSSFLSKLNISDGELFISRKDLLPKKLTFIVRPKNNTSSSENLSFKVSILIKEVNLSVEAKTIPNAVSFIERDKLLKNTEKDTQVKNTLASARAIADIYYSKKKSYLGFCKSSDDAGALSLIGPLETVTGLGTVVCADTKKTFVLAAPLSDKTYFCVDNIASALAKEKVPTLSCVGE